MGTSSARRKSRGLSTDVLWAAGILCTLGAASCSRDSLGGGRALDAAAGGLVGVGGGTGTGGAMGVGGAPGVGGVPGAGGALGTGGTSGSGGRIGVGGTKGVGGASGVGGATGGTFVPPLDGGIGGSGIGGSRATGGVVGSGGAASGGSSSGGVSGSGGSAAGGSATGGSVADGAVDASPDVSSMRPDTRSADLPVGVGFDSVIKGTWLVGWAGGARHYSWVRLGAAPSGTAEYLSGADLLSNIPFWDCDGQGSWFYTEAPYAIMLRFPSSCPSGLPAYFVFQGLPDSTPYMPGAIFGMVAPSVISSQPTSEWWKFPDDQCDATMSSCKSPF